MNLFKNSRASFALVALLGLCACIWPHRAAAETELALRATPVPIITVLINGVSINLEVDTQSAEGVVIINSATARRLGLRPNQFGRLRIGVDGNNTMLSGRIARPAISFPDGQEVRAVVGIFGVPVSGRADGVIGVDALPYETVTIVLGEPAPEERTITLPAIAPGSWRTRARIGGESYVLGFHLERVATVFNRRASLLLDQAGVLHADGELVEATAILGLTTAMQPVRTDLRIEGLPLGPTLARVNAPLLGALEEDAIVVSAPAQSAAQPGVFLGRAALSRCSSMTSSRTAGTVTLRCRN